MILSQKQRMKITWIFSETFLGSWSIKAKLHEGGYCGEGNRTNVSRKSPLVPSERSNCIEPSLRIKHIIVPRAHSINSLIIRIENFRRNVVMFI